jgi:hypothetical protein
LAKGAGFDLLELSPRFDLCQKLRGTPPRSSRHSGN